MTIMTDQNRLTPSFMHLLRICLQFRTVVLISIGALFAGSGINLLFPLVIRTVFDTNSRWSVFSHPAIAALILSAILIFQGIAFFFRTLLFGILGQKVSNQLRHQSFERLLLRDISFFDHHESAELVARLGSDLTLIQEAVSQRLSVIMRYGVQVAIGTVFMAYLSPNLTLGILFFLPILVLLSIAIGKRLKKLTKNQLEAVGQAQSIAQDFLSSIRVIRSFRAEQQAKELYSPAASEAYRLGVRRASVSGLIQSLIPTLMNSALVILGVYGLWQVQEGRLPFQDLVAFALYGAIVAVSFAFLASGLGEFVQSLGAFERVQELLSTEIKQEPLTLDTSNKTSQISFIELKSVGFHFSSRAEVEVLHDVSAVFKEGSLTAIVGASGAGKSTLTSILLGFYAPTSGTIFIQDKNREDISLETYLSAIGYVPQEPTLFNTTIANNLRIGNHSATKSELLAVLKSVNLLSFVEGLPQGLNTVLGERGNQISVGQRQRLAIARALLRKPTVLILDEATSALDTENEANIINLLQDLLPGKILIVVSHRLQSIQGADQILVLEGGKLSQKGTHRELAEVQGTYKRLLSAPSLASQVTSISQ